MIKMNFEERLRMVQVILSNCPYKTQKEKIIELFKNTENNIRGDVLLRLLVVDSCYSTNMNKRLFGFEELTDLILGLENKFQLNEDINVKNFIEANFDSLNSKIGISKKGESEKRAVSLITKYIYFRTKFNFPIYDRLVFDELKKERLIKGDQKPSKEYFKVLTSITNNYNISFDDLDKYFWVCGKVREGNLSLLISDANSYKEDFLDKLKLNDEELKQNSFKFNKIVSEKLVSEKELFDDSKLKNIQRLARSIKSEKVFNNLSKFRM